MKQLLRHVLRLHLSRENEEKKDDYDFWNHLDGAEFMVYVPAGYLPVCAFSADGSQNVASRTNPLTPSACNRIYV